MRFLALNEIWEWCREQGVALSVQQTVLPDPALDHIEREVFSERGRTGREPRVAADCVRALGEWNQCLLWVVGWGVWPNSEDWPSYYAVRGKQRELRSLEEAPGHLFSGGQTEDLRAHLTLVFENAWDAYVLVAGAESGSIRAVASHDGWVEVQAKRPTGFGSAAA